MHTVKFMVDKNEDVKIRDYTIICSSCSIYKEYRVTHPKLICDFEISDYYNEPYWSFNNEVEYLYLNEFLGIDTEKRFKSFESLLAYLDKKMHLLNKSLRNF